MKPAEATALKHCHDPASEKQIRLFGNVEPPTAERIVMHAHLLQAAPGEITQGPILRLSKRIQSQAQQAAAANELPPSSLVNRSTSLPVLRYPLASAF